MAQIQEIDNDDRFEDFDDESIEKLRQDLKAKNTVKSNEKCEKFLFTTCQVRNWTLNTVNLALKN